MLHKSVQITPEFRMQTIKALVSIIFFICIYILALALAAGLTLACGAAGYFLIKAAPKFIVIMLGIGLISFGIMILVFLVKFIFKKHTSDRSHLVHISLAKFPGLSNMLTELTRKIGTPMPKKVYLASDVNASVFYDSSFWSIFLPMRKNLVIGMGLINTVTLRELEAILAHEFGHFSQSTMKVGSMVSNVNSMLYNMLYENDSFEKSAARLARLNQLIGIFVMLAFKVITGIQWSLRKIYEMVNLNYLALSREMEFHADAIAASISGHEPLANSLIRMQFADVAYDSVINYYNDKITSNLKSSNIYPEQRYLLQLRAEKLGVPVNNMLPAFTLDDYKKLNVSKLVISDQWSSHPSNEERIERMKSYQFPSIPDDYKQALSIFEEPEIVMQVVTDHLFTTVQYNDEPTCNTLDDFKNAINQNNHQNSFPAIYNGYFDNKNPGIFNTGQLAPADESLQLDTLFSQDKVDLVYNVIGLNNDINTLARIKNHELKVKTFDYDGIKYKRQDAAALIEELENERDLLNAKINENDENIYKYFLQVESKQGEERRLKDLYESYFTADKEYDANNKLYNDLNQALTFTYYSTPFEQIRQNFHNLRPLEEELKKKLQEMLLNPDYKEFLSPEIHENLQLYLSEELHYFLGEKYFDDNLKLFNDSIGYFMFLTESIFLLSRRNILEYQESLSEKEEPVPRH